MKRFTRVLSFVVALVCLSTVLCAHAVTTNSASLAADMNYYSPNIWQPVPMVSQELLYKGYIGGEGCQWMTFITFDQTDGSVAFGCVDVGGLVKSTDEGKTWTQSTIGIKSEGTTGVTVDPTNNDRVAVIGGSSAKNSSGGLYFSTDEGETWSPKVLDKIHGGRDYRRQIAFDASSYDATLNGCKVIYWVTENSDLITKGIYKSTDGGETWSLITDSTDYAGSNIAVHPETGDVYLTNANGLYKSTDGGTTFALTSLTASINYLCTIKTEPNKIYITASDDMYVYDTVSGVATAMNAVGYPEYATFISVSPSDPNMMVLQSDPYSLAGGQYSNKNYYSTDGGVNWSLATNDCSDSFMPFNIRPNPSSFHPLNSNIVLKLGGDFIMRSEDGGATYVMSNDGNNAVCVGGLFNFNVNNSDLISISSQDYNGAYSTDGGKTWTYINWSGLSWGGFAYGSYMINETTMVASVGTSWTSDRELVVTYDCGNTITHTGITVDGSAIGMGVPGDYNTVFFADYRSTDAGQTWTKMTNCTGVFSASNDGTILFGVNGANTAVISYDKGVTWEELLTLTLSSGQWVEDIAYNENTGNAYVVAGSNLYSVDIISKSVTTKSVGSYGIKSIAVDPNNNDIMYAACRNYSNYSNNSAMRSVDGGETWTCINRSENDGVDSPDGGRAVNYVRVNDDGEAWFVGHCRGIWKMSAPIVVKDGDANANGYFDSADYLIISGYSIDKVALNKLETPIADANGDGVVDSRDVLVLKQRLLGLAN